MKITLDIETIPSQDPVVKERIAAAVTAPAQYKKKDSIQQWLDENRASSADEQWRKTALDGAFGHIAVIGYAIDDEPALTLYDQRYGNPSAERDILAQFYDAIERVSSRVLAGGTRSGFAPVFIGHNILNFDLRFLFQRSVMLGIRPPSCIPFNAKPWDSTTFDTMTAWAGQRGTVSLDKLCQAFGLAEKGSEIGDEIDGSKVWDFVLDGRIAEVAAYCAADVDRARSIHKRLTFTQAA